MRLDSITLHGFKSFGERTELRILPGVSCIVGPNGCGKSNISDAVRWALGEQSAKLLRGQRMDDVIFYGSASRKPVGLAEVELRFSNDGVLAVPWSEIAVARRLYRTGESEYLLNKQPTRLRDILDLFAGTGANPRAYSVMDQDKLNHVLTAKPHERRVFIEEAAGIARYKQQRSETQGKLDGARGNLVRVKDVMDEVKRQLGSLERQAKRAQQYKALEQERRDGALVLAAAERETTRGALGEAERLVAERTQAADHLAGLVERRRSGLAEERDRLEGLRLEQIRIAAERTDLMRSAGELRERESQLARRGERLATELREAETEAERIVAARTGLEAARDRALAELAALMSQREELAVQLAARERGLADAETRLADARLTLAARTSAAESLRELERVREGYDSGVRAIFEAAEREGRVGVDGVVGTVADLLRSSRPRAGCGGGAGRAPGLGRGRALRPGPRRRHVSPRTRRRRRDVLAPRVPVVSLRPPSRGRRCALDRSSRYGASPEPRPLPAPPGCDRRSSGSGGDPLAAERCQRDVRHAERRGAGADGATARRCGGRRGPALAAGPQTPAAGAGRADPRTDRDGGDHADHGRPDRS